MAAKLLFAVAFFLSSQLFAQSEVILSPGNSATIKAGQTVNVICLSEDSGGGQARVAVCDCMYGSTKYGEVVGEDSVEECQKIQSSASPRNCRIKAAPVICDCMYGSSKYGEVIGTSGLVEKCRQIQSWTAPSNCR